MKTQLALGLNLFALEQRRLIQSGLRLKHPSFGDIAGNAQRALNNSWRDRLSARRPACFGTGIALAKVKHIVADSQPSPTELLRMLLPFLEEDGEHWERVADECEKFASKLSKQDKAKMNLNSAIYRERAEMHQNLVARIKSVLGA
jgi:hypothetical protein